MAREMVVILNFLCLNTWNKDSYRGLLLVNRTIVCERNSLICKETMKGIFIHYQKLIRFVAHVLPTAFLEVHGNLKNLITYCLYLFILNEKSMSSGGHLICNQRVGSSSLSAGTIFLQKNYHWAFWSHPLKRSA